MHTRTPSTPHGRRASALASGLALLAALVLALGLFALVRPRYPLVDDYVQQLYASGRILGCGTCRLMPYTLSLVSWPLSVLYQVASAIPWYVITLLALIVVSFWVCAVSALRSRLGTRAVVCVLALLATLEALSVLYFTYTVVAFVATAAGLVLLVIRAMGPRTGLRGSDVLGSALVCLGFALRPESGMGAFAIFAPFAVWVLACNRHVACIMRGVAAVAAVAAIAVAGRVAYDTTPGWERYSAYLEAGRASLDYPELTADEMREINEDITDASSSILNKWIFIQSDPFDVEFFEDLGQSRPHMTAAYLVSALKAKTTWLLIASIALLAVMARALLASARAGRGALPLALGICLMALVGCVFIALRARVRLHVVLPMMASTLMALVACCHVPEKQRGAHEREGVAPAASAVACLAPVAVCLLCVVATAGFWLKVVRPNSVAGAGETSQAYDAYLRETDDIVIQGMAQTAFIAHDALSFEQGDYPTDALIPGGWVIYTAPWTDYLASKGLTNADTLEQLAQRDDMTLVTTEDTAETVRAFVEERLGGRVEKTAERVLGGGAVDPSQQVCVWRYSRA